MLTYHICVCDTINRKTAQHIVHAYLTGMLAKVGGSYTILSDNRTEFCNQSLIAVCDQLDIK